MALNLISSFTGFVTVTSYYFFGFTWRLLLINVQFLIKQLFLVLPATLLHWKYYELEILIGRKMGNVHFMNGTRTDCAKNEIYLMSYDLLLVLYLSFQIHCYHLWFQRLLLNFLSEHTGCIIGTDPQLPQFAKLIQNCVSCFLAFYGKSYHTSLFLWYIFISSTKA